MTHKERVLEALAHKETDRVPLMYRDVPSVRERLKKDMTLKTDDELLEALDIDFKWVAPTYVATNLITEDAYKKDIWGTEWKFTKFSEEGGYWNEISNPLAHVTDPAALDDYPWPKASDWDFSQVESACDKYSEYAIMTAPGIASPGIFQSPLQELLGAERSFIEPLINPEFFFKLVGKVTEFHISFIEEFFKAANGKIDFFRIGDDFGTQQGLFFSPDMWEEYFLNSFHQMSSTAKKYGAHYYQHSCGSVRDLIPSFLKAGVEVLDPLQTKAANMIPAELKAQYGDVLTFSGGVDEQELLPFGTPKMVKDGTRSLIDIMAKDGGFFLGPSHNFQDDIPTDNILAMYETAKNM